MGKVWSENTHRKRKTKGLVSGHGHNDVFNANRHEKAYCAWKQMLNRCYGEPNLSKHPSYIGCSVCSEWEYYSNFREWFYAHFTPKLRQELDKDILVKGNKIYSPETCCLVPHRINCLLEKNNSNRGELPIGVFKDKTRGGFSSTIELFKENHLIGTFNSPKAAFSAYKLIKEAYIKLIAGLYYTNGFIEKRVYDALLNYTVEITD